MTCWASAHGPPETTYITLCQNTSNKVSSDINMMAIVLGDKLFDSHLVLVECLLVPRT